MMDIEKSENMNKNEEIITIDYIVNEHPRYAAFILQLIMLESIRLSIETKCKKKKE